MACASGAGTTAIDTGIIQWGGFTIGRAGTSYFDNPWAYAYKWGPTGWHGNPDTAGGRFVAAYTHQFGNGISGTLSLEDNKVSNKRGDLQRRQRACASVLACRRPPAVNTSAAATPGLRSSASCASIRPGAASTSPATLINNHVAYNCGSASGTTTVAAGGCSELSGNPSDKVGGGSTRRSASTLPTGVNDALYIGGTYAKGDLGTSWGGVAQGAAVGLFGGTNVASAYGSVVGRSTCFDSVYTSVAGVTTGGGVTFAGPVGQQLTTGYGGSIAFDHGWNAEWRTSVFGGVQVVDYNSTANAILCSRLAGPAGTGLTLGVGGANVAGTGACNWDYPDRYGRFPYLLAAGSRPPDRCRGDLVEPPRRPRRRHGAQHSDDRRRSSRTQPTKSATRTCSRHCSRSAGSSDRQRLTRLKRQSPAGQPAGDFSCAC